MHRDCDRARQWASIEVDGELSKFEHVLLEAHVSDCPACAEFHAGIRDTAEALRSTPLERLDGVIEVRRAWRRTRLRLAPAAAAMAVAAVGLGSLLASTAIRSGSVGSSPERAAAANPDAAILETMDLRTSRALEAVNAAKPARQLVHGPQRLLGGGIVVDEP